MRTSVRAGAVLSASAALFAVLMPASAEAASSKRGTLKVCFDNQTPRAGVELDAVADGPSFRSKTLGDGDCKKWSVRTGQYMVGLDNAEEFFEALQVGEFPFDDTADSTCPGDESFPRLTSEVTRNGDDYDSDSRVQTNVQKNRKTKVEFTLSCEVDAFVLV